MADLSDVENAIVTLIAQVVYPGGIGQPSISGNPCMVYAGWPTPAQLDADLAAGKTHISVYPSGQEVNVTRYSTRAHVMSVSAATLTLSQAGNVITVGGAMPSPFSAHNMAVLIGNQSFIYAIQSTDTLTSIATGLATLIAAQYSGTVSSGDVITLPSGVVPSAVRVGTVGTVATEWERQKQRFQITIWAPNQAIRTVFSAGIKIALAQIAFLTMPDGFGARIKAAGGIPSDLFQKVGLYRRDLFYEVEFATTITANVATVVAHQTQYQTQTGIAIISTTK